jgi:hypothetical protein
MLNHVVAGRALAATSTIFGVAAQAYQFSPLTTAVMAVALCGSLFALRLLRRRVDARQPGSSQPAGAAPSHFAVEPATEPTEPPARR